MQTQQPPRSIWPLATGALFLMALFWFGVRSLIAFGPPAPDEDAARSAERTKAYSELQAEDATKLDTFAWADRPAGKVQIPITLAMQLTIPALQNQTPKPAYPINPPPEPPAPEPTPEATPLP